MKKNILFSIVIPTYNRADFITKTIQSVLSQSYTNFEIIVIDDGSTDHTAEVVRKIKDPRLQYFKKENKERGAARNAGTQMAKGEYINFFDSDDLLYPNHLQCAIQLIHDNCHPQFIRMGYDIKSPDRKTKLIVNKFERKIGQKLITGNLLSCSGVFLRRDIAVEFPFSEDRAMSGLEDWELWLRVASHYELVYSNIVTSTLINHEDRSVLNTDIDKLIKSKEVFLDSLRNNGAFMKALGSKLYQLKASICTYVSLHIAITKRKRLTSITYLIRGIIHHPKQIFTRRFLAIIKHLIY